MKLQNAEEIIKIGLPSQILFNNTFSIDSGVSGESQLNIDPGYLIWQIVYRLKLEE